jgi:hypothetical protein
MQRVKTTLKFGVALGSALSAIGGLIGDFLVPIAPFALYLSILGFSLLGLSILAYLIKPVKAICAERLGEIWYSPLFWLLFIFSGLTYAAHSVSDSSSGNGVLADNIAVVGELQEIVFQLKRIADDSERRSLLEEEERNSAAYRLSQLGFSLSPDGLERAVREKNENAMSIYMESGLLIPTKSLIYLVAEGLEIEDISALLSQGSVKLDQFSEVYQFPSSSYDYSGYGKDSFFEKLRTDLQTKEDDYNDRLKSNYRETRIKEITKRLREIDSIDKKQGSIDQSSSDKKRQAVAQKINLKVDSCLKAYSTWSPAFPGSSMKSVPEDCKGLVDSQGMKNEFLIKQQIDLEMLENFDNNYVESTSRQDTIREKFDLSLELDHLKSNPQSVTYPESLKQELTANLTVMSVVEKQKRENLLQKLKALGIQTKPICSIETESGVCIKNRS